MAAMRNQLSYVQERQYTVQAERGGCLTAWLIFVGIANVLGLIFGLALISSAGSLSLLILVSGVVALVGVVGIWQLKKWGYFTLMACYLIGLLFSALDGSLNTVIGTIIGMAITSLLVFNKWGDFE
jgi:hypothetical protein